MAIYPSIDNEIKRLERKLQSNLEETERLTKSLLEKMDEIERLEKLIYKDYT